MKALILFFCLFFASDCLAQDYKAVKSSARDYFLSLAGKKDDIDLKLMNLKSSLTGGPSPGLYDTLSLELNRYEAESQNLTSDSTLWLFNSWYLKFSNFLYDSSQSSFFAEKRDKMILFSTSMSCYCTLKMCLEQTIDIMSFARENNLGFWIIDSYEHSDLQIQYETLFAPSVILLDSENNLLSSFVYDEQMISKLTSFYSERIQK